ncbi:MAG: FAD-dependent oxidoreductase, partial [Clostridium sp.]|nr:FAD-dependent oxidoreductase [Clostridium sp.]
LKRNVKDVDITIIEKQTDISYGACGFPYFIEDVIKNERSLISKTSKDVLNDGIDLRLKSEAIGVDFKNKSVKVRDLKNENEYDLSYDKLVIATGGKSVTLKPLDNIEGIFSLNTLEDANNIKDYINTQKPKKAVIVGGGSKGIELLETFTNLDIDTTVVEFASNILNIYDEDISTILLDELKKKNYKIQLEESVESANTDETGKVTEVVTNKGSYEADLVIQSIGIRPNTDFLKDTELEMDRGAIVIDKFGKTNIEDVYSGGDCALIYNHVEDRNKYLPLGTNSNKIGKLIALSIAGKEPKFKGVQAGSLMKTLGYELAINGITDSTAKEMNLDFDSVLVKTRNKSGYYPDNTTLYIKLTFMKDTGKLIGAQLLGKEGDGLRIQGLAVAIYSELTVYDLEYLDFGYIPALNSVWDSINVAAGKAVRKL